MKTHKRTDSNEEKFSDKNRVAKILQLFHEDPLLAREAFLYFNRKARWRYLFYAPPLIDLAAQKGMSDATLTCILRQGEKGTSERIEWNRPENVRLNNASVSDAVGHLSIHETYSGGGALNRLDGPHKQTGRFRVAVVPSLTIDHYASTNSLPPIHFMKIDVEGHEMPVLQGAREVLIRSQPILLIECEHRRSSASSTPEKILSFIQNLPEAGYYGFLAGDCAFTALSKLGEGNIIFVPKAKQENVSKLLGWS